MLELARTYRIGISVIRSGHPINVFGTNRPSDHPRGRAFDGSPASGEAGVLAEEAAYGQFRGGVGAGCCPQAAGVS
jgi:hypothetical protein